MAAQRGWVFSFLRQRTPLHRQAPYAHYPQPGGLPVTESAAARVISLPMHAYLEADVQDRIISAIRNFVKRNS